jgi:integrase
VAGFQASEAIHLFLFFLRRQSIKHQKTNPSPDDQWKLHADDLVRMIRLKHLSINTEKTYLTWLRSFYRFVGGKPSSELNNSDVKDFLTHLAADRRVSPSSQNQAFNALLFFYRHVLKKEIDDLDGTLRARRKKRLPVVLTKQEIHHMFQHMKGINLLMARLVYGGELRLQECRNLRIKDIDFKRRRLTILQGKGGKDRETLLPDSIRKDLHTHSKEGNRPHPSSQFRHPFA